MNIAYSFKNLTPSEKSIGQNYFESKVPKLQKSVDNLYSEAYLEVRIEKFVKKSAYNVSLSLKSSPSVFASEDDHTLNEAIDLALDKLMTELRKLNDNRKDHRP